MNSTSPQAQKHPSQSVPDAIKLLYLLMVALFANMMLVKPSYGHGTIIVPESRIYKCRFRDNPENPSNPACKAAKDLVGSPQPFYDWNGVRQGDANGNHQALIPDGELCGAGNPDFRGLNLARSDWQTSPIEADANGKFEFIYHATAPHATRDMIFYITKVGWQANQALGWGDLVEFCRVGSGPLINQQGKSVYKMSCDLPARSGQHVIYHIWQRSDSGEAFYACSDVKFSNQPPPPPPPPPSSTCKDKAICSQPAVQFILSN